MQRSVIGIYSIGVVAENKALDSDLIQVIPVEVLNLMDGELNSELVEVKSAGLNEDGTEYTVTVKKGATIEAEWFGETNRVTSPDVRRGEQVWIWQSENADKFYWTAMGRDDNQRRLETVIYRYSGIPENVDEEITADNSYFLEFSTHDKTIILKTSRRNGEVCIYTFHLDPGTGTATLQDDVGNIIQIDTADTIITVKNALKSYVVLEKEKIEIVAPDSVLVKSNTINLRATDILIECSLLEIKCPQTKIKGRLDVEGIYTKAFTCPVPLDAPGIKGAPFVPGPSVPPVAGKVRRIIQNIMNSI
jgi:hypothetical protein